MLGLNYRLSALEERGEQIKVSIVGAGQMGKGMVSQMMSMQGMKPAIVVDINVENAIDAYKKAGVSGDDIKLVNSLKKANEWLENGKYIVTDKAEIAAKANSIQAVVDATGVPEVGAKIAIDAITNKKHIVMLNVETDVVIGPLLKKMADNAGVIYTGSAGDEPGSMYYMDD